MNTKVQSARVSVAMPALNAEKTIEKALGDLVVQTFRHIEIVVCDNASNDRTADIADKFAARDSRIRVVRFADRVDILHSFKRAFDACAAPYFMFAPADDRWYPLFVEALIGVLDARPEVAACAPLMAYTVERRFRYVSVGTRPLSGTHRQRLRSYFADPADNARAFGLYRRQALAGAFPSVWFPGWDYVLIAATLARGEHAEHPAVLMERDRTPDPKYVSEYDAHYRGRWRRWLPLAPVATETWRRPTTPVDIGLMWNLALFVLRSHLFYATQRTRRWGRIVTRLARFLRFERWPVGHRQTPTASTAGDRPSTERSLRISSR